MIEKLRTFFNFIFNPFILVIVMIVLILLLDANYGLAAETRGINNKNTWIVAVIDTGFGYENRGLDLNNLVTKNEAKLCKTGHKDFTNDNSFVKNQELITVPTDCHGHGTNIVGVINNHAGHNSDYCLVILKFWSNHFNINTSESTIKAIQYAIEIGADVINYSGTGTVYSKKEADLVKTFINEGGFFVAAAGNENKELKDQPTYPAMDDNRVIVVGGLDGNKKAETSNYGDVVDIWADNTQTGFGITLKGTSQATAAVTGKIIHFFKGR